MAHPTAENKKQRARGGNSSDRERLSALYAEHFHPRCDGAARSAHCLRSVTRGIFVRFPYVVEPQQGDDRDQSQINLETNIDGVHTETAFCGRAYLPGPWSARPTCRKARDLCRACPSFFIGCAGGRQSGVMIQRHGEEMRSTCLKD